MKRGGSQAAFKGGHTSMSRHRPGSRPRCPMKDTPPEGDRAKDLPRDLSRRRSRPTGQVERRMQGQRHAQARHMAAGRVIHRSPRRRESLRALMLEHASRARRPTSCALPGWNARGGLPSTSDSARRASHGASARSDLHIAPSGPLCAAGRASARRDLCARAGAAVILAHAAGRLPHRQAVLAGRRPPPEAAQP